MGSPIEIAFTPEGKLAYAVGGGVDMYYSNVFSYILYIKVIRLKDRGIMKWMPVFIQTEHMKMMKEAKADYYKLKKPVLDEHEIEEINNTTIEAMEFTQEVTVTYFEDGAFKPCMGYVHFLDQLNKHIRVMDKFEDVHRIKFENIINVQII
ncbi:YolD-like family protein [Cytobacillus sp. Hm23]